MARPRWRRAVLAIALLSLPLQAFAERCRGVVYLTLDTGNMSQAEEIASILARHEVRATFFLANERTPRGDSALESPWAEYWKTRAAEGHAFGTHTWRHGRIGDAPGGIAYRAQFGEDAGRTVILNESEFCKELRRVDAAFRHYTGRPLDAVWRAPGGHATARARAYAQACGYAHVRWADAGFLGDELASEKFPNRMLLERALRDIRDGDVLMAHLGIWSRKEPFAPMLDPLIAGLRQRGFCFRTLREHPDYRRDAPSAVIASASSRATSAAR